MVKSYVKIYGPPILKAIGALEAVAVNMSKAIDIKFSHRYVPYPTRFQSSVNEWNAYLKNKQKTYEDCYKPVKLIS
ncbi:MAG: hypothetical protein JSV18_02650 [Candidatus Bathyarchaeota archaeon]|nr:MAG: hypothetical protein JSV18_02650 [Candidatus Bathyarchaeota archaeon]